MGEALGFGAAGAGEMAVKACVVWSSRVTFHLYSLFVGCQPCHARPTASLRLRLRLREPQTLNAKPWRGPGWAHIKFFPSQGWETLPVCRLRFVSISLGSKAKNTQQTRNLKLRVREQRAFQHTGCGIRICSLASDVVLRFLVEVRPWCVSLRSEMDL